MLQIRGFQFGASRGSGTVFFKNANDGGNSEVACDDGDFLPFDSWSDTLIQLWVPSADTAIIQTVSVPDSPAGTGTFRVLNNNGLFANSPEPLSVAYSVYSQANLSTKPALYLGPSENQSGQFVFHLDSSVAHFQDGAIVPVIKKALKEWSCLTGVNWVLQEDSSYVNLPGPAQDSICVIKFGPLSNSLTGATTLALNHAFGAVCSNRVYTTESDLIINEDSNIVWFIDTIPSNPIPAEENDLYFALLHELGHAHNLNHVIDPEAILHFVNNTEGSFRKIELYYDECAYDGGNWVMDKSVQFPPSASCTMSGISIAAPLCSDIFSVSEFEQETTVLWYPNPSDGLVTMLTERGSIESIVLIDLAGKVVLSSFPDSDSYTFNLGQFAPGLYLNKVTLHDKSVHVLKMLRAN